MNWEQIYVVAGLSTILPVLVHLIYGSFIKQAQQNMGIAAGPRVDALTRQRKQMVILAVIIGPVLTAGFSASGHLGGKPVAWRDYTSNEAAYAAQFPGEFHESNRHSAVELLSSFDEIFQVLTPTAAEGGLSDAEIEEKVAGRNRAKKAKDFALADSIRKELLDLGIVLEDSREGTRWKRK